MKQLIGLLALISLSVVVTVLAQGNPGKVAVFFGHYRIDMSLNFAILMVVISAILAYLAIHVVRVSGNLPARIREWRANRKQQALLTANTQALIALITGDEQEAQKALNNAIKTGVESDLSYMIRIMSAIQADRYDVASEILKFEKARQGDNAVALAVLSSKVALASGQSDQALNLLSIIPEPAMKLPQVQRVRLLALLANGAYSEALGQYRACEGRHALSAAESQQYLGEIYQGLCRSAGKDPDKAQAVLSGAKPNELTNVEVVRSLAALLHEAGLSSAARKMLEQTMGKRFSAELISIYHEVALQEPQQALPYVESLLEAHPSEASLLELAGDVCEAEQLWGKAIARFETVYQRKPSASTALKLHRLYLLADQTERAKGWAEKAKMHLEKARQIA